MLAFAYRRRAYKIGILVLLAATLMYLAAFICPYWSSGTYQMYLQVGTGLSYVDIRASVGLWMTCVEALTSLSHYSLCEVGMVFNNLSTAAPEMEEGIKWVRAFSSVGLLGVIGASLFAICTNFCRSVPGPRTRLVEWATIFSGLLGFVSAVRYMTDQIPDQYSADWGVYAAFLCCVVFIFDGILIAAFNSAISAGSTSASTSASAATSATSLNLSQLSVQVTETSGRSPVESAKRL